MPITSTLSEPILSTTLTPNQIVRRLSFSDGSWLDFPVTEFAYEPQSVGSVTAVMLFSEIVESEVPGISQDDIDAALELLLENGYLMIELG